MYGKPPSTTATLSPTSRKDDMRNSGVKAQDRLKYLEDLVRSIVDTSQQKEKASPADNVPAAGTSDATPAGGDVDTVVVDGSSYTGSTHWSAILQHIHELKNDMVSVLGEREDEPIDVSTPDALFGAGRPPSLNHVLKAYLPPRIQVDRRIAQYFNAKYLIIPIIHSNQFRRQYEEFWQDSSAANPLWVSIMFSICCLAATLSWAASQSPGSEAETPSPREAFQTAAGQCLVLGNYSKPQPHVVEALALFLQCKYSNSLDPQREVTLMFGVQTRLAYLMGYHRDGSKFPKKFTPFEAEMRRRAWAMVKQFDLMVAFQLGIPNNVPPNTWDTENPSNLLDADFDEDTKVLPPSRPESDITQIMYFVAKARIVDVYAKICYHAISFTTEPLTASEILSLDSALRQQADRIPESLKIRPMSESITDQAHEVMVRLNLSFLWRKALCVLHRKHMSSAYSYKACVEAASCMCASIIDMYPEFQPGGTYGSSGWMLTSFTITDFLLATIVLCLALSVNRKRYVSGGGSPQTWLTLADTNLILGILDRSQAICIELAQRSREAKRVTGVLSAVLKKLRTPKQGPAAGADGARYFMNMTNGTTKDKPYRAPAPPTDQSAINLKPLRIHDGPTSVNANTGMWSGVYGLEKFKDHPSSEPTSSSSAHTKSPSDPPWSGNICGLTPEDYDRHKKWSVNAGLMHSFNMDDDLGPFSNIMEGLDDQDLGTLDWTQFDQFTGAFGNDSNLNSLDPIVSAMPGTWNGSQVDTQMNYDNNWESTPMYLLGARARDPVTGQSVPT